MTLLLHLWNKKLVLLSRYQFSPTNIPFKQITLKMPIALNYFTNKYKSVVTFKSLLQINTNLINFMFLMPYLSLWILILIRLVNGKLHRNADNKLIYRKVFALIRTITFTEKICYCFPYTRTWNHILSACNARQLFTQFDF